MRAIPLAAAFLLVLGCAETAPTTDRHMWGWVTSDNFPGIFDCVMLALGAAMLVSFARGLRNRTGAWNPLIIGLFMLGPGLLWGAVSVMKGMSMMANSINGNQVGIFESLYDGLWSLAWGTGFALAGGLFTVILRWRNERFRKREAEAEAEA